MAVSYMALENLDTFKDNIAASAFGVRTGHRLPSEELEMLELNVIPQLVDAGEGECALSIGQPLVANAEDALHLSALHWEEIKLDPRRRGLGYVNSTNISACSLLLVATVGWVHRYCDTPLLRYSIGQDSDSEAKRRLDVPGAPRHFVRRRGRLRVAYGVCECTAGGLEGNLWTRLNRVWARVPLDNVCIYLISRQILVDQRRQVCFALVYGLGGVASGEKLL